MCRIFRDDEVMECLEDKTMIKCMRCGSARVAHISAKHSDTFSFICDADGVEIEGDYAPDVEGLCEGDYTDFHVCLECGQMQGDFPKDKVQA